MNQLKIEIYERFVCQIIRDKLRIKYSSFKEKINKDNWSINIQDLQNRLREEIGTNPNIYNHLESQLHVIYDQAVRDLSKQSNFSMVACPFECPYTCSLS